MKVHFYNVGRNKAEWVAECAAKDENELDYEWFYRQAKKHLMSSEIDFLLNKDDKTNGIIIAGFHTVGNFRLEK